MVELSETEIFQAVLLFLWIEYFWETYLSLRQHMLSARTPHLPQELEGIMERDEFQKARAYSKDKRIYNFVEVTFSIVISTIVIMVNGFVFLWDLAGYSLRQLNQTPTDIPQSVMFMLYLNIFNTIMNLPFGLYYTFVLEEVHGFNKQTAGFFIKDKIKKFVVSQAIGLPIVAVVVYIVREGGDYFFLYMWAFMFVLMLFLLTIYPDVIAPLFDKYTPLKEGELRTKIEALAASIEFPLHKLYVVEGSKRSAHSNAYFYGFFKNKHIVLFDTLLQDYISPSEEDETKKVDPALAEKQKSLGCTHDEVLAVLSHELGHWKYNHVLKNLVIAQINLLFLFLAFGLLYKYEALYRAFGFHTEQPVFVGLILVMLFIFSPYNAILSFLMNILCRHFEYQADAFALSLRRAEPLKSALIKLNKDNLGFPIYDWMYSAWHHSHPQLLERLKALEKQD